MTVTDQQKAILQQLRDSGCAVVVFSPDDLQGVDRSRLESLLRANGWDLIEEQQALCGDSPYLGMDPYCYTM